MPTEESTVDVPCESADVVVVGSRLGGCAAAIPLARAGRRVIALDRMSFPSDQLSTHVLMPAGVMEIERMGALRRVLEERAAPGPDGTPSIAERLTHQALASEIGCSREMVSRLLKDLETGGYLAVRERRLTILRSLPARW